MKQTITTLVGNFSVYLSYQPTADDMTINNFADVINKFVNQQMLSLSKENPELDAANDYDKLVELVLPTLQEHEADIEKALYDTTRAGDGAGKRLTFNFSKREIEIQRF